MEGPFQIHRRLAPVVDALIQAGYSVKWVQRWSGSKTDYLHPMQSGIRSVYIEVYIEFPDGYKSRVTDNMRSGEEPEWFFDKWYECKYHMNDMPAFLQKVAQVAQDHL